MTPERSTCRTPADTVASTRRTLRLAVAAVAAGAAAAASIFAATGLETAASGGPAVAALAAATTNRVPPPPPRLGPPRAVALDDVGDPFVLTVPAGTGREPRTSYLLFWTTDWDSNVPAAASTDLVHWHRLADALPVLPSWAEPSRAMTWAPSAVAVPGGWVLYFSTEEASSGQECIGAAFATSPAGPYRSAAAAPLLCQRSLGGSIDPSPVVEAGGRLGLVWKSDGNAAGRPVSLWESALTPTGQQTTGPAYRLLTADRQWQQGIIEGPSMRAASRGGWWLTYSAGSWQSTQYATGLAWCATVRGPCQSGAPQPLLRTEATRVSPGGLETFRDATGALWAAYSTFPRAPQDRRAAMAENRVLQLSPVLAW